MSVKNLSLNGDWQLYREGQSDPLPATVPGCVHTDLLASHQIPDPFFRDNELDVLWVGETDWTYRRTFRLPGSFLERHRVALCCHGLDTIATVRINGTIVGQADNMFRQWRFDIKPALREGENEIEIAFRSPMAYVSEKNASSRYLPAWGVGQHKLDSGGWIRKEPCNFGWDWGPMLATCGIWRDIEIVGYDSARLENVHILQDHKGADGVQLTVHTKAETLDDERLKANIDVMLEGQAVAHGVASLVDGQGPVELQVDDPQLWWPNGMGEQPLYDVRIELLDRADEILDSTTKRIGLRTLELVREPDAWGESFHFAANGVPFFAKGANWIPDDVFATRMTRERYARSLQDAVDANMNMLRVWGGGLYEQDVFYDLCDELGLCVWQDFIFSCATYPAFDDDWMANVRVEAEQNVKRIRHHACLALWCGNNELEQGLVSAEWTNRTMSWADYKPLFDELLPEIVAQIDPQTDYWPSSPHSPCGDRYDFNNPTCGDAHLWSVWHGKMPFEWYRTCEHRFNSEFGFQSFPEPRTTYAYTEPGDRNITSYVMEHHQRSAIGNTTIMSYMCDWFRLPRSFEMTLWLSQILQGMAIKYAVEHWRRAMPQGMGTLYWQLNDCWPVASWSSVDSYGRWKALHYMARQFYAPLLVSGVEDIDSGLVAIHVTSDKCQVSSGETPSGVVRWQVTDLRGETLDEGTHSVEIPAGQSSLVTTLDLAKQIEAQGPHGLLVWLGLDVGGETVSTNLVTFARPKHLPLEQPNLRAQVQDLHDGTFRVMLTAERPALWAWIELLYTEARFSDAFVHVAPGHPFEIIVTPQQPISAAELRGQLQLRSLVDTFDA